MKVVSVSVSLMLTLCVILIDHKAHSFITGLNLPTLNPVNMVLSLAGQIKVPQTLPKVGVSACSTYPTPAGKKSSDFQTKCFYQKMLIPDATVPYKCGVIKHTVGVPVLQVPTPGFDLPVGYAYLALYDLNTTANTVPFVYRYSWVELSPGQQFAFVTNYQNITYAAIDVFSVATDKGYVLLSCALPDLAKPVCATINYAALCTYEQFPPKADVDALVAPLYGYPYYFAGQLKNIDQTNCPPFNG